MSLLCAASCPEILDGAQRAFAAREFDAAATGFGRANTACPNQPAILVALGQVLYVTGKEMEAEQAILKAISIDGSNTAALYALGRIYYQQKRYPEAVTQLQKTVQLDPTHYKAWDNLGVCYDALNRDSDALRSFFHSLDLVMKDHQDYDWAHANLADYFLRRNEYEKAFQLAAEAARRNPASARNCFLSGKALVKLEKFDLSLRWLERATQLDNTYSEAFYLLSQTYRKMEREEDSTRALARFRELSKSPPARR